MASLPYTSGCSRATHELCQGLVKAVFVWQHLTFLLARLFIAIRARVFGAIDIRPTFFTLLYFEIPTISHFQIPYIQRLKKNFKKRGIKDLFKPKEVLLLHPQ
jgi:hypothetical protein